MIMAFPISIKAILAINSCPEWLENSGTRRTDVKHAVGKLVLMRLSRSSSIVLDVIKLPTVARTVSVPTGRPTKECARLHSPSF
jgi:hypothetical protein